MAKKKTGKSQTDVIARLQQEIANLKSKQLAAGNPPKKKKNKKKKKSFAKLAGQLSSNYALKSDYARAVLDPFNVRGARVPDSFMLRTGVSWGRFLINSTKPTFNFTNWENYVLFNVAPIFSSAQRPLVVAGTQPATAGGVPGSFWNIGAANTLGTGTWVVNNPYTIWDVEAPDLATMRISGGGLRINVTGGSEVNPILMYIVPSFNGDPCYSTFQEIVGLHTRAYSIDKPKESITIPLPIRSTGNAYNWIRSITHPGNDIDDYPVEDGPFSASQFRSQIFAALSTDNTAGNTAVNMWSMQSGIGGLQVVARMPPGCAWSAEYILHIEYTAKANNVTGKSTYGDDSFDICLSDSAQIEAVGNAAAAATQSLHESHSGNESVMEDLRNLRNEIGSQAAQGIQDAMEDTQALRQIVGMGLLGVAGGARYLNRRHQLGAH